MGVVATRALRSTWLSGLISSVLYTRERLHDISIVQLIYGINVRKVMGRVDTRPVFLRESEYVRQDKRSHDSPHQTIMIVAIVRLTQSAIQKPCWD